MTARRPALQLVREGNQGHHPLERLEGGLRLPSERPDEPDWRTWWPTATGDRTRNGTNRRARNQAAALWREVVDTLHQQGLVAPMDRAMLVDVCVTWAQLDGVTRQVARDGLLVEGARGNDVRHPLLTVANQLRSHLLTLGREYGLTVLSRDKLPGGRPLQDDVEDVFD